MTDSVLARISLGLYWLEFAQFPATIDLCFLQLVEYFHSLYHWVPFQTCLLCFLLPGTWWRRYWMVCYSAAHSWGSSFYRSSLCRSGLYRFVFQFTDCLFSLFCSWARSPIFLFQVYFSILKLLFGSSLYLCLLRFLSFHLFQASSWFLLKHFYPDCFKSMSDHFNFSVISVLASVGCLLFLNI